LSNSDRIYGQSERCTKRAQA